MSLSFRNASECDATNIATLHNQCVKVDYDGLIPERYINISVQDRRIAAWRGWINRSQVSTFIAEDRQTPVGFTTVQPDNGSPNRDALELIGVYVLPSYWGRGIGRKLLDHALQEAIERKCSKIVVWEIESNTTGRNFYESLGFKSGENSRIFLEQLDEPIREVEYYRDT